MKTVQYNTVKAEWKLMNFTSLPSGPTNRGDVCVCVFAVVMDGLWLSAWSSFAGSLPQTKIVQSLLSGHECALQVCQAFQSGIPLFFYLFI